MQVLLFASAREAAGTRCYVYEGAEETQSAKAILQRVVQQHPALESVLKACVLALNHEYIEADRNVEVKDGDELAVIPPLSGG